MSHTAASSSVSGSPPSVSPTHVASAVASGVDDFDFFFEPHASGQSSNNVSMTLSSSASATFHSSPFKVHQQHQQAGTGDQMRSLKWPQQLHNPLFKLPHFDDDDLYASSSDWVDMSNCSSSNGTISTSLSPFSNASSPSGMSVLASSSMTPSIMDMEASSATSELMDIQHSLAAMQDLNYPSVSNHVSDSAIDVAGGSPMTLEALQSFNHLLLSSSGENKTPNPKKKARKRATTLFSSGMNEFTPAQLFSNKPPTPSAASGMGGMYMLSSIEEEEGSTATHTNKAPGRRNTISHPNLFQNDYFSAHLLDTLGSHNLINTATTSTSNPHPPPQQQPSPTVSKRGRRRSSVSDQQNIEVSANAFGETVYLCTYAGCNRSFTRLFNCRSHLRTHTGEKPFICGFEGCDARFSRNHDLKRHVRVHTGDKPYQCERCGKKFSRLDALNRHCKMVASGHECCQP